MADYFYPERDNRNHIDCLMDTRLHRFAKEALGILNHFPKLWVYDIQVKPPHMPNACFFVYHRGDERIRLINLTIIPSDLMVEFRMAQYLPADVFHKLPWQNKGSNKRASFSRFGQANILNWMQIYLDNLRPDYEAGKIKRAGTSVMEGIIANYFALIYPDEHIRRNYRPDTFRGKSNRPLELDIYLPREQIAIEIQGHRHSEESVAERDRLKIEMCRIQGIDLLSIDWEKARTELLSQPLDMVLNEFRKMVETVRANGVGFIAYQ